MVFMQVACQMVLNDHLKSIKGDGFIMKYAQKSVLGVKNQSTIMQSLIIDTYGNVCKGIVMNLCLPAAWRESVVTRR
jgi:hypothetical protein